MYIRNICGVLEWCGEKSEEWLVFLVFVTPSSFGCSSDKRAGETERGQMVQLNQIRADSADELKPCK